MKKSIVVLLICIAIGYNQCKADETPSAETTSAIISTSSLVPATISEGSADDTTPGNDATTEAASTTAASDGPTETSAPTTSDTPTETPDSTTSDAPTETPDSTTSDTPTETPASTTSAPTEAGDSTTGAITDAPSETTTVAGEPTGGFDSASFIGGIILGAGIVIIVLVGCQYYRKKPDYNVI